jgi:hypothetical protein
MKIAKASNKDLPVLLYLLEPDSTEVTESSIPVNSWHEEVCKVSI